MSVEAGPTRLRDSLSVAYLFTVIMAGTTLPTPLYAIYAKDLALTPLMITVIYSVYALGVLATLQVLGRVSDHVGRRPVIVAGAALSAISAILFATTENLPVIFAGRIISGASAGLVTGAATAYLTDLEASRRGPNRAAVLATVANIGGLGLGPLLAGVLAEHVSHPLTVPFVVDLILLAPILVLRPPETVRKGDWRDGVQFQRIAVPPDIRLAFAGAAVSGFAAFALLGFTAALVGQVLAEGLGNHSHQTAGACAFLLLASAAAAQVGAGAMRLELVSRLGLVLLPVGAFGIVAAVYATSLPLLVASLVVGGVGDGLAFRGGLSTVTQAAPPDRRAEVISAFFIVAYVGITIPVVAAGVLVTATTLHITVVALAILVAVLSAGAAAVLQKVQQPQL